MYEHKMVKPNWQVLGPKFGANVNAVATAISETDPTILINQLETTGQVNVLDVRQEYQIAPEDVTIEVTAKENYVSDISGEEKLFLHTELSPELREEGFVRDVVRRIQAMRKDMDLDYAQQIEVYLDSDDFAFSSIEKHQDYIAQETLATKVHYGRTDEDKTRRWEIDEHILFIGIIPLN
jgi:isoleucyl-tRNA synthetase